MSTLLQRELRDAMAQRNAVRAKLHALEKVRAETTERAKAAAEDLDAARVALREAAGSSAVGDGSDTAVTVARKRIKTATDAAEIGVAEAEGVAERVAPLERELAQHEAHVSRVATRISISLASNLEHDALALAEQLGRLLQQRKRIGSFCFQHAGGHDPLQSGNEWSEFRRNVLRRLGFDVAGEATLPIDVDPVTLESLATMPMVGDEAIAAE